MDGHEELMFCRNLPSGLDSSFTCHNPQTRYTTHTMSVQRANANLNKAADLN